MPEPLESCTPNFRLTHVRALLDRRCCGHCEASNKCEDGDSHDGQLKV